MGALAGARLPGVGLPRAGLPGAGAPGVFWAWVCAAGQTKARAAKTSQSGSKRSLFIIILGIPCLLTRAIWRKIFVPKRQEAVQAAGGSNSAYCTDDSNRHWA